MAEDSNEHLGSSGCSSGLDRRRGRDTLTNEDATYGWRKSFQYVAKRQNGVQEQVRILPDPLASERLVPVVRGSLDAAINVLASCSRIEGRAKRTSSVGPTRACVTAGETAILQDERPGSPSPRSDPSSLVTHQRGLWCIRWLCEREVMDKIEGVWDNPYSTLVVTQTIHTGCSKCFGTGSVYVQVFRGNGGWTQMWMVCDLCSGKGHA